MKAEVGKQYRNIHDNKIYTVTEIHNTSGVTIIVTNGGNWPSPLFQDHFVVVDVPNVAAIFSETKELFSETNLDYLDEPHRTNGKLLQAEMLRLQAEGMYQDWEVLCTVAADNLGNEDGRYYGFYVCLNCGCLYHGDYSTNSDPDRDFCKGECEVAWVLAHPDEPYNGEYFPQDEEE